MFSSQGLTPEGTIHPVLQPVALTAFAIQRKGSGEDICICTAESLCCTPEIINIVNQLYPIQNKKFKKKGSGGKKIKQMRT